MLNFTSLLSAIHFIFFYLRLADFKNFPEPAAFFQDFPVLENFQVLQDRPHEPCLTIISHVGNIGRKPFPPSLAMMRPIKKKHMFVVRISIKKRAGGRFLCYLLFPVACFLYTLLPSTWETLELLGQILIKRNIRY